MTFTDSRVADIAAEINNDETLHVKYLRSALGGIAVAEPAINLNALGIGHCHPSAIPDVGSEHLRTWV